MRSLRRLLAPLAVLAAGSLSPAVASDRTRVPPPEAPEPEYSIKAQMLIEMLAYVQWPARSEGAGGPFDLVVMGRSPFGAYLDDYARSRTVNRRPIRVRYLPRAGDPGNCDAIFLCPSEAGRAEPIWAWARTHQALTVADDEVMAQRGAMVTLLMEGRFVRPVVNLAAASAAGISFRSRLLQYARILPTPRRPAP